MNSSLLQQLEERAPAELWRLLQIVRDAASRQGATLYLVGGAVRDLLIRRSNFDLDLVVEADALSLAHQVAGAVGAKVVTYPSFGTARVSHLGLSFDLATARAETYSRPGSLPAVRPGSINEDLFRRDFTINAMAIRLNGYNAGNLIDLHGGERDLRLRLIRILHPGSFQDDPTRILRALRYEQRLSFQLESVTEGLLQQNLTVLDIISRDRIRHELELFLTEECPERILGRAEVLDVLTHIYPSLKGNGWLKQKLQLARSTQYPVPLILSLCLLAYHFTPEEGENFTKSLKFSRTTASAICDTLRLKNNLETLASPNLSRSHIYHLLKDYSPQSVLTCALASDLVYASERLHLYLDKLRYVKTILNGKDLLGMGLSPGEHLGEILHALHTAKLDQEVRTRREEEEFVRNWISTS